MLEWLDAHWLHTIVVWVSLSFSLAALYIGICLLTRRWHRWRRRRALDLELPGHTRIGIDRRKP